jgi:hypothetical protein
MSDPPSDDAEANTFIIGCIFKALIEKEALTPAEIVNVLTREKNSAPSSMHARVDEIIAKINNAPRRIYPSASSPHRADDPKTGHNARLYKLPPRS